MVSRGVVCQPRCTMAHAATADKCPALFTVRCVSCMLGKCPIPHLLIRHQKPTSQVLLRCERHGYPQPEFSSIDYFLMISTSNFRLVPVASPAGTQLHNPNDN